MSESDGIEDAFEGQLRMGLLIAGRVAEELARQREQAARTAEQQSAQAVRDLQERATAERTTARAVLVPLERTAWWDRARPADIETAWQTARQWADVEPDAARAAETIREQVRIRYGIDVDALEADHRESGGRGKALARALDDRAAQATAQAQQQRVEAEKETVVATLLAGEAADERAAAGATPTTGDTARPGINEGVHRDLAEHADGRAAAALKDADAADSASAVTRVEAGYVIASAAQAPTYDSPQRRAATARDLHAGVGTEHSEAVEAKMTADVANARPAGDAASAAGRITARTGRQGTPVGRQRGQAHGVER
ncbi:hypothetical protein [Pseudokineococcus lusitanus]|uniref:Colicin import membrane protein n=1 Tax=Pseudokineococcus lusitanus TaxID=763993 RepID=A0A3N1HQE2_9ACTN|nr:hypothetical protein [Pseudokineococcus lusitanus]ROP44670.1 colicin import membrane protein [Pseudokineococcus lusitanus]